MMQEKQSDLLKTVIWYAAWLWIAVSCLFILSNTAIYALKGKHVYDILIHSGPFSSTRLTLACVALVWLSLGVVLFLLMNRTFRLRYGFPTVCAFALALLYINICRERVDYGDVTDYVCAAHNLATGTHFHSRYLYPPLWATILEPLVRFGPKVTAEACWVANILSLVALFGLLTATLQRYHYSQRFSSLVTLIFMAVNVPVIRTLFYVQVNMHVTNMILLALLSYPRLPIVSALSLAIAVHLKASPIVLVLPFILEKDRKWMSWFGVSLLAIASITYCAHGLQPFQDFINNACNVYRANDIAFRENSVDSLVRSATLVLDIHLNNASLIIALLKGMLLVFLLASMGVCIKRRTFHEGGTGSIVINATPSLLVFMLIASPLIWEHHPVFIGLSFLVAIRKMNTPSEWALYGFAYFLEYLLPTFDFFPWSFGRLLSPVIVGALLYKISTRGSDGIFFRNTELFLKGIDKAIENNLVNNSFHPMPEAGRG